MAAGVGVRKRGKSDKSVQWAAIAGASLLSLAPNVCAQSMDSTSVSASVAAELDRPVAPASATRLDYRSAPASTAITLPPIDDTRPAIGHEPGVPLQIGVSQAVPVAYQDDLLDNATWVALADGTQLMSVTLRSAHAGRVRVALQADLPEGARVRFFAPNSPDPADYPVYSRADFASRGADDVNADPDRGPAMLWSPIVDGDTLGIEVELPPQARPADARLRVVRVSHIFANSLPDSFPDSSMPTTGTPGAFAAMADENCPLVDVACKELSEFPNKAVTRIIFTNPDGNTAVCSGTVINTPRSETDNNQDPYLLTAHHCIATQDVADTAEFDFFYAFPTCDGT